MASARRLGLLGVIACTAGSCGGGGRKLSTGVAGCAAACNEFASKAVQDSACTEASGKMLDRAGGGGLSLCGIGPSGGGGE